MRLRTGFTLVELIIVLVVLAVLVAATIGFLRQRREAEERAIEAGTPGDLAGTVTYLGEPVSGARVWLNPNSRNIKQSLALSVGTGADGTFEFTGVRPIDAVLFARVPEGGLPGLPSQLARWVYVRTRSRPERVVVKEIAFPPLTASVEFPTRLPYDEEVWGVNVISVYGSSSWERFEAEPASGESNSSPPFRARVPAGKIRAELRVKGIGYSGSRYIETEVSKDQTLLLSADVPEASDLTFKVSGLPISNRALNVGFHIFHADRAPDTPEDLRTRDLPFKLAFDIWARLFTDEFTLAGVPPGDYAVYAILRLRTTERVSEPALVTIQPDTPATVQLTIPWEANP